ncbi:hypothetical protein BH09MYX1_BH09MYX1_25840 [soil metagenome]
MAPSFVSRADLEIGLRAAAGFVLVAGALVSFRSSAPGNDVDSLAAAIGAQVHGVVAPKDIRWEPSRGAVTDALRGRFAIVLASAAAGGARDVYRVRIRVSPEGHPIEIGEAYNLTSTPLGDDHALVLQGNHAAFATFAYGQEQSVTALDLAGEGSQNAAESTIDRLTSALTNFQQTGTTTGIARVDVGFEQPAERLGLTLDEKDLSMTLANDEGERQAVLDLDRGELLRAVAGLHADPARHLPKRPLIWAVDTVRAVSFVGPKQIAWLEEKVFAVKDTLKQTAFKMHGQDDTDTLAGSADPPQVIDSSAASADDGAWPPAKISSIWKTAEPGEGEWMPRGGTWMKKFPVPKGASTAAAAPPPFYETFVRPDEARPYAKVILVAMDMRQLELEMEAGTEDPKPLTGQHGPGRLPRDPAVLSRVVAAYNGAFKTEHGNYGMMVHRRVLLPPQPAAATVILTADGRSGFGTWGKSPNVTGVVGVPDGDITSFRQNLDPLLDHGVVNPTGRALWGYTLPGNGMQTERSGICVTSAGHMMYAWGDDVSATMLGKAMKMAGCSYGMHLDMNPHHTGFVFTSINQIKGHDYHSELLSPLMEISTDRYIEYAPKDFFYMLYRDPTPPPIGAATWSADPGTQPAPSWSPGVWATKLAIDDEDVELTSFEGGRATLALAAGTKEPDARTGAAPSRELDDADKKRVVASVTTGVAAEHGMRGLTTAGKVLLPMTQGEGLTTLVLPHDGSAHLMAPGETVSAGDSAIELPLLATAGTPTALARLPYLRAKHAAAFHAALGLGPDGKLVVATADAPSPLAITDALIRAGCTQVVLLDRGEQASATIRRAGTDHPPVARADETTIYFLAKPMRARSFRFDAE